LALTCTKLRERKGVGKIPVESKGNVEEKPAVVQGLPLGPKIQMPLTKAEKSTYPW